MRRIFSTVFGPHEPAFTVGSLAISATLRPPISGEPGDHAVGAEALLLPVGEQRLLGERLGVDQARDPLAHRQLALLRGLLVMALGPARQRRLEAPEIDGQASALELAGAVADSRRRPGSQPYRRL